MTTSRAAIPLIFVTLALSFAAVALIVNGALTIPSADEVAALCAQATVSSQTPVLCPETNDEKNVETVTINPTTTHPGFVYPLGFNALAEESTTGTTITLAGSGLFFSTCLDCTNNIIAIFSTTSFTLDGSETLDTFVQALYADNTSVIIQKDVLANGTQYTIAGNSLDAPFGPFTHIRFFGATSETFVFIPESDLLPLGTAERDAFISSFDFSLIP